MISKTKGKARLRVSVALNIVLALLVVAGLVWKFTDVRYLISTRGGVFREQLV